ncbi:MAG: hypothetical protein ABI082_02905 [Dokdonella sp.]
MLKNFASVTEESSSAASSASGENENGVRFTSSKQEVNLTPFLATVTTDQKRRTPVFEWPERSFQLAVIAIKLQAASGQARLRGHQR